MEVRILGPLEVVHRGEHATLPSAKPRALLNLLAARPNQPASPGLLADELWGTARPTTAASALRTYVAQVRRLLQGGEAADEPRVNLSPAGYTLRVRENELDALAFEAETRRGRDAALHGDLHQARAEFTAALARWRGTPFLEADGVPSAHLEGIRLAEVRLRAIEELADVRVALGEQTAMVDWLVDVVNAHPLHEGLTARLMRALRASGRPAEALRAFRRIATDLDEQLGVAPSADLRRLEEDILLERGDASDRPESDAPVTPRVTVTTRSRFIGRRAQLMRLLEPADAGTRLVLVTGEPGIGKSTLVGEYRRRVERDGSVTVTAHCEPDAGGHAGLRGLLSALESVIAPDVRPDVRETLAVLERGSRAAGPTGAGAWDYEAERLRLLDTVARAMRSLRRRTLCLVVEDLHSADRELLTVVRHVLRQPDLDHVRVVATMRDHEVRGTQAERIAGLCPPAQVERIPLEGFEDYEVVALVRSIADAQLTASLQEFGTELRRATNGNPLHVRAFVRELEDTAGESVLTTALFDLAPNGVRPLLERQLERLPQDARTVAHAAAVAANDVAIFQLAEVCGFAPDRATSAVEALLDASVLVEDDTKVGVVRFNHALHRNCAYHDIGDAERARLHERVAGALAAAGPGRAAEIAHHSLRAGTLIDDATFARIAIAAGDESLERLAFSDAARWYGLALERGAHLPERERAIVLHQRGRALEADHQFELAHSAYAEGHRWACAANDVILQTDLATAMANPWAVAAKYQRDARQAIELTLANAGDGFPRQRLRLLAGLATNLYFEDPARQGELASEVAALAGELDDEARATACLAQRLWLTRDPPAAAARAELARTALDHARRAGSAVSELRITREFLTDLLETGERDLFDVTLDGYEALAQAVLNPRAIYSALALRATQATIDGDLARAEQLARGAALRGRELGLEASGLEFFQRFVVRFEQDRLAEFVPLFDAGDDDAGADVSDEPVLYRAGAALTAVTFASVGRHDDARRVAQWTLGQPGEELRRDSYWLGGHALLAATACRLDDFGLASAIAEAMTPCAAQGIVFGSGGALLGSGHHWLGALAIVCGDLDVAAEQLRLAARWSETMRAPYWLAKADADLAEALGRIGGEHRDEGDALRAAAASAAAEHGFGGLAWPRIGALRGD